MNLCCWPQGSAPLSYTAQLTEATIDPLASAPGAWGFWLKPLHVLTVSINQKDWNHENP